MPRPIVMTDEMKESVLEEFSEILNGIKMSGGTVSYEKSFKCKGQNATVWLTPEAYKKILALVTCFSGEVAWHGTVSRIGDFDFIIEDIIVYPQEVSGCSVNTDWEAYTEWLYALDDGTFNMVRMQGHSHVNMDVSPSGVDNAHRQQILQQLDADMFYIFMIWNKSLSSHTLIYDMEHNVLYEDGDVDVMLLESDGIDEFLADARGKVSTRGVRQKRVASKAKEYRQAEAESDYFESIGMHDYYDLGGSAWRL